MAKKIQKKTIKKAVAVKKTVKKAAAKKKTKVAVKKAAKPIAKKKAVKQPPVSKQKQQIKKNNLNQDTILSNTIIEGMQEKKAAHITVMNLIKLDNSFCNYFVICDAESTTQIQAIANSVEEFTRKKLNIKPHHIEGVQNAEWILLDYLTVVVHIFRRDMRDFYNIESLWADAEITNINS